MNKTLLTLLLSTTFAISGFTPINNFSFNNQANAAENAVGLDGVLMQVRKKVAPDKRIHYFDVKVKKVNNKISLSGKVMDESQKNYILKTFKNYGDIENNIEVFPFSKIGEKSYGITNLPVLNVRDNPRHSSQLVTQGLLGRGLKILDQKKDWLLIEMENDSYLGWVKKSDVLRLDKSDYQKSQEEDKVMITKASVKLLNSADKTDVSNIKVYMTTMFHLLDQKNGFYKVLTPDGNKHYSNQVFYIHKDDAKFIGKEFVKSKSTFDIVKDAKSFISTPYLWGGTSSSMVDCSGFTQTLFRLNGYHLPRDADQQQKASIPVEMKDLKAGDLVFFKGHVGMYIGDDKFIHSSVGYGGVFITSFNPKDDLYNDWYIKNYKGAGRVIN